MPVVSLGLLQLVSLMVLFSRYPLVSLPFLRDPLYSFANDLFVYSVVCFHHISLFISNFQNLLLFSPSQRSSTTFGTMTSADFLTFGHTSLYGLLFQSSFPQLIAKTSPGKNAIFLSIYLPHLHEIISSSYWTLTCSAALSSLHALYVISIRRTRDLPTDTSDSSSRTTPLS